MTTNDVTQAATPEYFAEGKRQISLLKMPLDDDDTEITTMRFPLASSEASTMRRNRVIGLRDFAIDYYAVIF